MRVMYLGMDVTMKEIILDFKKFMTAKSAHRYIERQMDFQDYYGRNLDALYDCLTDISDHIKVKIINCDMLDHTDNSIVNVFWDAAEENELLEVEVERGIRRDED